MKLIVNGEKKEFKENITLKDILNELKIEDKVMAIAVNMNIVKKENWDNYHPKNGDKIEMLTFVAGG
ncbi:sulfur carrier protein ThiS [Nitrosophilus kaiyonis]|uniref:sulfur carrier protein ThiS n=1 Tax=Nitrosophilus kaiyonis TaxID=2930200 RepID=UPI0024923356|nr:sulfur carrier protein ThiS [Nitrosophilus kaiyonis]